ncbi:hypothetical protein V2I85_25875 [Pseudomonas viridiflava]|uniref:hypothetical protein n=1 Tax=Pseudomonas viridiflava TaxID=33069 RepID=UPI002E999702|nr:hypothetical protein [Pseudomonas viridiflava]
MTHPYFPALVIGHEPIDLSHLEPFTFEVQSHIAGKALRVHVTFSNHCFSKGFKSETHPLGDPIIDRSTPRPRTFCPARYRLSHTLPMLIRSLAESPKTKVWETTAERNWCYSIRIEDPAGAYNVFFEVRRAAKDRRQWQDLQLVVESAYHTDDDSGPRLKGSMAFVLLCGKTYKGLPTATRR